MHIKAFGTDYYLDGKAFAERFAVLTSPPYRMEEVIAIQQRMRSVEDILFEQMKPPPDPLDTLRKHLDEMIRKSSDGRTSNS